MSIGTFVSRFRQNAIAGRWQMRLVFALLALGLCACQNKPTAPDDHAITEIGIERTACKGPCPVYTFVAYADGKCRYRGTQNVERQGEFTGDIPQADFHALATFIKAAKFDNLRTNQGERPTDLPSMTVTVTMNGRRQAVTGFGPGDPPELREIGKRIDALMAKTRWNELRGAAAPRSN